MKNKKNINLCKVLSGIFLFLSLLLIINNYYEDYKARNISNEIIDEIEKELSMISLKDIEDKDLTGIAMPKMRIGDYDYIGEISIEKLGIQLPVMDDWDYEKLKIAPTRYSGSVYDKNLVIAAHNYRSHFGGIHLLNIGDYAKFIDVEGHLSEFEVVNIEVLDPTHVEKFIYSEKNDWHLTLFTCTLGGTERTTVRFKQIY